MELTIVQGYLHRTIKRFFYATTSAANQVKGLQTAEEESIRMRRLLDRSAGPLPRRLRAGWRSTKEPVHLADQLEQVADLARNTLSRPLLLDAF